MTLLAAVGYAHALEGSEAGAQAAQAALNLVGRAPVRLALVIASCEYPIHQVFNGVTSLLGDTPLLGFSTTRELTSSGQHQRSVAVALLAGSDIHARTGWWPGFSDEGLVGGDTAATSQKLIQDLQPDAQKGALILVGDGLGSEVVNIARQICARLDHQAEPGQPPSQLVLAGCLAGGDLRRGRTYQIGGRQSGSGGLAAGYISGNIAAGIGVSHGWTSIGVYAKVTRSQGVWVRNLDDCPASDTYARLFGYRPREWGLPPLNELVRLYPLGIEIPPENDQAESGETSYLIRSPLRMESDGSLRMNAHIPEGSAGFLMVGRAEGCLESAKIAAQQSLDALMSTPGKPRPVLALVFVDLAWQLLMQAQPGEEIQAIRSVLGKDVPIVGGYTLGQIARSGPKQEPELLNQHIQVVLFGELEGV
ncbi:MAG: hypothetical protein EHM70_19420 [Chloroflexota bacterium]|nr:MAG: hypothetical protein EHM70_19420 [Chloroflexota bacterium]